MRFERLAISKQHPGVIREMKDALRDSIFQTCQNSTLVELARIFRSTEIYQDICWTIAKIQEIDKHYLDRRLVGLRELFKNDDKVSSVPDLNRDSRQAPSPDSQSGEKRVGKRSMWRRVTLVNPRQNLPD